MGGERSGKGQVEGFGQEIVVEQLVGTVGRRAVVVDHEPYRPGIDANETLAGDSDDDVDGVLGALALQCVTQPVHLGGGPHSLRVRLLIHRVENERAETVQDAQILVEVEHGSVPFVVVGFSRFGWSGAAPSVPADTRPTSLR